MESSEQMVESKGAIA